jgi:Xaa-Pro aminopeptidase
MDDGFPRFSDEELDRRRRAIDDLVEERRLDDVLVYGTNRFGSAVQWLSEWPVSREQDLLLVQFYNHGPTARRLARRADVRWGGPSTIGTVVEELERRGSRRIGLIGPLGYKGYRTLAAGVDDTVDLDPAHTKLRLVKSTEELDWLRRGAELSDRAVEALRDQVRPGMDERNLGAIVEGAYVAQGGTTHIHYFGVTSMEDPDRCVPSQLPSTRTIRRGDVLTTEISAAWWGHPGQVLRTMTIDAEPTPAYEELHRVADAAYDAILGVLRDGARPETVVDVASDIIDGAGYTIYDDLVHGFGGGYFPPILGTRSRSNEEPPDLAFRTGMTVVVQPNVITTDERMGVQTGALVAITDDGVEELHRAPRGLWRAGGD